MACFQQSTAKKLARRRSGRTRKRSLSRRSRTAQGMARSLFESPRELKIQDLEIRRHNWLESPPTFARSLFCDARELRTNWIDHCAHAPLALGLPPKRGLPWADKSGAHSIGWAASRRPPPASAQLEEGCRIVALFSSCSTLSLRYSRFTDSRLRASPGRSETVSSLAHFDFYLPLDVAFLDTRLFFHRPLTLALLAMAGGAVSTGAVAAGPVLSKRERIFAFALVASLFFAWGLSVRTDFL